MEQDKESIKEIQAERLALQARINVLTTTEKSILSRITDQVSQNLDVRVGDVVWVEAKKTCAMVSTYFTRQDLETCFGVCYIKEGIVDTKTHFLYASDIGKAWWKIGTK